MILWLVLLLSFLTTEENSVVSEVNLLRTRPQEYMKLLEQQRANFSGKVWTAPGQGPISTQEGLAALEEAIAALRQQAPLEALEPSLGLSLAAREHVRDQALSGATGHKGADGSQPRDRTNRYGSGMMVGENLSYGCSTGRAIVMQLLIDDGVPDRGHRVNLLRSEYRQIGVAIGRHARYRVMCAMDLANGYQDKAGLEAPTRDPEPSTAGTPRPAPTGGPFEQARATALAHYQAIVDNDRAAWMATWSASQRGYLAQRWTAARAQAGGDGYRYAGTQKVSPSRMTLVFVRKSTRCSITLILEAGGWRVEEASY